jgi:homoserine O-acetyltransferase/O-succinyltransferase
MQYDANSYMRIQAAMDEMDLEEVHDTLENAFWKFRSPALLISFDTDWLFPTHEVEKVARALDAIGGRDARHIELHSPNGHDAFLIDFDLITPPVKAFLRKLGGE